MAQALKEDSPRYASLTHDAVRSLSLGLTHTRTPTLTLTLALIPTPTLTLAPHPRPHPHPKQASPWLARELYALARWREIASTMHRAQQHLRTAAERWWRACRWGL